MSQRTTAKFSLHRPGDIEAVTTLMREDAAAQGRGLTTFRARPGPVAWTILRAPVVLLLEPPRRVQLG